MTGAPDRMDEVGAALTTPRRVGAALAAALLVLAAPGLLAAAEVTRFTPQGTVKGVRQVTARFSEPVVRLGDPAAADPFEVECPAPGAGRWVDSRTWAYEFEQDLPAGLACAFRLRAGLTALGGSPLTGRTEFAFATGGPAIVASGPAGGASAIDEEQVFVVTLDGEATVASILAHVGFAVEGLPDRVPVRLLTGEERERILAVRYGRSPRPPHLVLLQARQRFPSQARVSLVWGRGVATPGGVGTEQDQTLAFRVRPAFAATFSCERESARAGCVPVSPMTVRLSAPVRREAAARIVLVEPDGKGRAPTIPGEAREPFVSRVEFRPPFPESSALRVEVPADLTDDAGRRLGNAAAFPLAVRTAAFPPLAKFTARFGILEARAAPVVPVTVRRLEPELVTRLLRVDRAPVAGGGLLDWVRGRILRIPPEHSAEILPWLRRVGAADRETSVFGPAGPGAGPPPGVAPPAPVAVEVPRPAGSQALQVVGIPLGGPGLYVVELESAGLGAALLGPPRRPMFVPTAALVTNLAVHWKEGRESSLAWVTALDTGRPVGGARVTAYDCRGTRLWQGTTDRQGLARAGRLPARDALPRCPPERSPRPFFDWSQAQALAGLDEGLFVVAQTVDDLAFVHASWEQGIEPWRFNLPEEADTAPVIAHTVLDRALYRAGETVHLKHLLRAHGIRGFAAVPEAERPTRVSIRHQGSEERWDLPLAWTGPGVAVGEWTIPPEARLGRYEVVLVRPAPRAAAAGGGSGAGRAGEAAGEGGPGAADREWPSARFRVEEFRVPLMRGTLRAPAEPLVAAGELPLDVAVQYLAGGPAAGHPVTVRAQVRPRFVDPGDDLEGFVVANGAVREGLVRRGQAPDDDEAEGEPPPAGPPAGPDVHQREALTLDAAGTGRVVIRRLPAAATPQEVLAELEVRDPNGEIQTVATTVPLWPAARLVGLKPDGWVAARERLAVAVAVTDLERRPVAGAPVRVDLFLESAFSHRKRLVGGFYAYEHVVETRRVGELCRGTTDARGRLECAGPSPVDGNVLLQATTTDEAGRTSAAHESVWVAGSEEWWFEVRDHDRMDLLPERRRYEPGETARLQVRMPFREATGLVAVEREGVLDAWVVPLSGKAPVVEVPVQGLHAPNVYVSVLAVRGRVGGPAPTALADLGRPAFRLGVAELRVGWRASELRVGVAADRAVYRVRERARVTVTVRTPDGRPPPAGAEVALAAVDEGLLELAPNPSWELLEGMLGRRGYAVRTATAQMHVVGKRHFGLKALAPGGGGGRQPTRELFDTLLFWQARVPLDPGGRAQVEVPLGDALSSFRIVAVATAGLDRFGTGATTVRTTQDLMVFPGLPPLVREGDRFRAEVTLRNATDRRLTALVRGRVEELADPLAPVAVVLDPAEARVVGWDVTAPAGVTALRYEMEAGAAGGPMDRVRASQRVVPAVPLRTTQATLVQWAPGGIREPVARPPDALPGRGGVAVTLRPALAGGLDGVREWMRRYPYTCLEQRVSRAVALRDERLWRDVVARLPAALDAEGFLKYFPAMEAGSEVLTAYVLAVSHEAGWTIPPETRERMEDALLRFVEGTLRGRSAVPGADLAVRRLAALEALSRTGRAEPRHLQTLTVEPALWPTSAVLDWRSVLHRLPGAPDRARRLRQAGEVLRARLDLSGTTLGFSTERADHLWWLMVSADVNAVRLLLHALETGEWGEDAGRLVRGALARQRAGAWDLTVANAWGALAVERFSRALEAVPVGGTTAVTLGDDRRAVPWPAAAGGETLAFPWPAGPGELTVDHAGPGRPWVTIESRAAIPLAAPRTAGYRITRTVTPVEAREPGRLRRGDVVRVRLEIEAQRDMTWVVVEDPVPAGASHLGTGLARDSALLSGGGDPRGRRWPSFEERGFEHYRAYFEFVPKGRFAVEYAIRLNQDGRFQLPPTRVEALYAPELYGERPNAVLEVAR